MSYQQLDLVTPVQDSVPMIVREAQVVEGPAGPALQVEGETPRPTIAGIELTRAQTHVDERRVLVVCYNRRSSPGMLGYTVVVRPGCSVGDHYHHRREERILLIHGRAQFRLQDQRPASPTYARLNLFAVDTPGVCVRVPAGVAHSIIADGTLAVLQVLASCDYDPADDVPVPLSRL